MNIARVLALTGAGALVVALIVGFWPVNADMGFAGSLECGSPLRPVNATDSYSVLDDMGAGLAAATIVEEECETARTTPTYVARIFGFAGVAALAVAVTRRRPRTAAKSP
ncbi:hypothetical protein ACFHW2_11910 [Actinomadura sp. LOL_016]|uniref:hypothetical protein n=1 Tax=unclassified Actinomadura TaxID=2626254 RepID=UPI003A80BCFF